MNFTSGRRRRSCDVKNAVAELTGHPPASVAEFLAEHSDVLFSVVEPATVGA
jgi:hypothetical protein